MRGFVGIDNGVSGSIGYVNADGSHYEFWATPVKKEQDYTKKKKEISRIDGAGLRDILVQVQAWSSSLKVVLERPMVNPQRFAATASALRAHEATLIILESLKIPFEYVDSKQWQKEMLPAGIVGAPKQKKASLEIGRRLFPTFGAQYTKQKDADGILMAEWARRSQL